MKTMNKGIISMKKYIALIIAGAMLLLSACDTLLTDAKDETAAILPDVYLAGGISNMGDPFGPCIFKNGQRIFLERHPNVANAQYNVNAVFVDGDDVYATGSESVSGPTAACYWKNGKKHLVGPLSNPYDSSIAYSIFVSNNNVYLAGQNGSGQICIWSNGLKLLMPYMNNQNGYTTSVIVHNGTIYVTGIESGSYPVLYKISKSSMTATYLFYDDPEPANQDYALFPGNNTTIVVDGSVYIAGYSSPSSYPAYWHNGTIYILDTSISSPVTGISYRNGDIYCSGVGNDIVTGGNYACYWKNSDTTKHWLVPLDPANYSGSVPSSIYITDSNDIIWSGFIQIMTGGYGFVFNNTSHTLQYGTVIPHMFVKE
jgi:hypothetical protein